MAWPHPGPTAPRAGEYSTLGSFAEKLQGKSQVFDKPQATPTARPPANVSLACLALSQSQIRPDERRRRENGPSPAALEARRAKRSLEGSPKAKRLRTTLREARTRRMQSVCMDRCSPAFCRDRKDASDICFLGCVRISVLFCSVLAENLKLGGYVHTVAS